MRLSTVIVRRVVRGLGLIAVLIAVFVLSTDSLGQTSDTSLGDLARKQRQKQLGKNPTAKPKKVVTDEDMPAHAPDEDVAHSDNPQGEMPAKRSATDVLQTGDQFKSAITRQKAAITDLKSRIDKLNSSIHFVEANAYRNGVEYNKVQAQKQQEVERLQGQLNEQQRGLEQMQETARKAGYGSAVWDP
jgi:uncharacterized protein YukE